MAKYFHIILHIKTWNSEHHNLQLRIFVEAYLPFLITQYVNNYVQVGIAFASQLPIIIADEVYAPVSVDGILEKFQNPLNSRITMTAPYFGSSEEARAWRLQKKLQRSEVEARRKRTGWNWLILALFFSFASFLYSLFPLPSFFLSQRPFALTHPLSHLLLYLSISPLFPPPYHDITAAKVVPKAQEIKDASAFLRMRTSEKRACLRASGAHTRSTLSPNTYPRATPLPPKSYSAQQSSLVFRPSTF